MVQWFSHVRLFATSWTAVYQTSLSFTISWSLLELWSIESVMLSNHLILCSTPVLLPGKSHGLRSLVGCSAWGRYESGTTERLHFHFSLSCIGEGNGNPLQCSCLENPRDRGAWWASVSRVAHSQTRLSDFTQLCGKVELKTLFLCK